MTTSGSAPLGSGACAGRGQVRVGLGRPPHGLRRVVDQDVERALGGDLVGERDHLSGIAQVEADDAQAIDPVRAVVHRGEAPDRVVREARRDRRVGAVAEQPQRDVHPDLGPAAGEQRAPSAQIGVRVPTFVVARRTRRTQLVVERVDFVIALLADVTRAGAKERSRPLAGGAGGELQALGLVVDAAGRTRRGRGRDRVVVLADHRASLGPALLLDDLEQPGDRAPHRDGVGVLGRKLFGLGEDAERIGKAVRVDPVHLNRRG